MFHDAPEIAWRTRARKKTITQDAGRFRPPSVGSLNVPRLTRAQAPRNSLKRGRPCRPRATERAIGRTSEHGRRAVSETCRCFPTKNPPAARPRGVTVVSVHCAPRAQPNQTVNRSRTRPAREVAVYAHYPRSSAHHLPACKKDFPPSCASSSRRSGPACAMAFCSWAFAPHDVRELTHPVWKRSDLSCPIIGVSRRPPSAVSVTGTTRLA